MQVMPSYPFQDPCYGGVIAPYAPQVWVQLYKSLFCPMMINVKRYMLWYWQNQLEVQTFLFMIFLHLLFYLCSYKQDFIIMGCETFGYTSSKLVCKQLKHFRSFNLVHAILLMLRWILTYMQCTKEFRCPYHWKKSQSMWMLSSIMESWGAASHVQGLSWRRKSLNLER